LNLQNRPSLTSGEIASMWTQYMNDSMALCMNSYLIIHIENQEIKSVFKSSLELGKKHLSVIRKLFSEEGIPIPIGFTNEDVNLEAPRLYSDTFCLNYLHVMSVHGISGYGVSLPSSSRKDVRSFYVECMLDTMELYNHTIDILLANGLYERPPLLAIPEKVSFVKSENFIKGWVSDRRSLNAIEISNISFNLKKSIISKALVVSFYQVAKAKDVRKFLSELEGMANKHIEEFGAKLQENHLPTPLSSEDEITDSTISPFTDKFIMFHSGALVQVALAYYGAAMATSMRADLIAQYSKIIVEDFKGAKNWFDIMIDHKWFEKPPEAVDRGALAKKKK
jgi:hypothetical protein